MTKSEMRFIRRELISLFLRESALRDLLPRQWRKHTLRWCKEYVREYETNHYGQELQAYK